VIVVIDTNVWISALQFAKHRGTPTLALERAMSEDVIATCDEIDAEIVRVLTEKVLLGKTPGNVGAANDSCAWHPREDSRHGQGMP
jgi:predicted nucleic acid-binding protein